MKTNVSGLPNNWCDAKVSEITTVNPTLDKAGIPDDLEISFVPMPAVQIESGIIDVSGKRRFSEVKKGYTPFREGDVLFAKITPCMENGKMAVVPEVINGIGFGSTEFHVLRALSGVNAKYVYYYVSSQGFRREADHNMSGAVGQRRVTTPYLSSCEIPLPPTNEQHRIVAKIEELFSELDKGIENLKTARAQLKVYRQALLKHAFEGKLTAQWRKENQDKLETADALLKRIQQERAQRYQQQLADWETSGKQGSKPKTPKTLPPLTAEELAELPELPEGWGWCKLGDFIESIDAGKSFKCDEREPRGNEIGVAKVSAVTWGEYDESESKTCTDTSKENEAYLIRSGDFILSRANTIDLVGACVIARKVTKKIMLSDKTLRIRFDGFSQEYFLQYLGSRIGRKQIMRLSTGNQESMRNIGQERIRSITVPICSVVEADAVIESLAARLSEVDQLELTIATSLQQSEALRQSILKKAFSGQLVPQDPREEPASALLARIKAEKAEHNSKSSRSKRNG